MPDRRNTTARVVCGVLGVVLLAVGIVGLAQTGLSGFEPSPEGVAGRTDAFIGGSTLLNLVHVFFGALALLAAIRGGARLAGLLGILAFAGLLAYDVVALIADDPDDPLGSRWPALVLHGIGLIAAIVVVMLDEAVEAEKHSHE
ncbi:DUF4383 domain-containing protein [Actinokineospora soli]|uniref:DUF4383 domain-containing protein n=1 Tax=Actinokineospora soli TaxID=1048753 RepID=A0ABW2TMF2_9PSEU